MFAYFNPYSGQHFFGFLLEFLKRMGLFFTGQLSVNDFASDEIQIIVLVGMAASAALVGSFLVLRRMTMLANSLSHTILLGIVIAFLFTSGGLLSYDDARPEPININAMLLAAFLMGIVTTFFTEFLTKTVRLQEDASTGVVFTTLFALGIILVTLFTRNAHIGTEVVMGNVDALRLDDCKLIFVILGINLVLFFLFFKEYKITTFDAGLAKALGISTVFFNYLLMSQASLTIVGAFRAVGVLMVLAFITGPPLIARLLTDDLKKMLLLAVGIGAVASIFGVAVTRHILSVHGVALSTAGVVVCTMLVLFVLAVLWKKRGERVNRQT